MNRKVLIGISFACVSLLQIVFLILKLCGAITWHWALVLLPLITAGWCGLILLLIAVIPLILSELY